MTCRGESLLFRLVADAAAPRGRVEAPGSVFARGSVLARMLLDAGVLEPIWDGSQELDPKVGRLLVKAAANPNTRLEHGETPLMQAAHQGLEEAAQLLLDKGADVHLRDHRGRTALMHAVLGGHPDVAALLRFYGAELQAEDAGSSTPRDKSHATGFESAFESLK